MTATARGLVEPATRPNVTPVDPASDLGKALVAEATVLFAEFDDQIEADRARKAAGVA